MHYKNIDGYSGDVLSNTLRRDNIKNTYCKENKIPLYRIPYWEVNNLEKIISSEELLNNYLVRWGEGK